MANRGGPAQRARQPNFRTDPQRNKTQKWVNAHQYTYDGDDWGDADEFNEYDGYDASASKPTGLRQPGQALPPSTEGMRNVSSPEQSTPTSAAPGIRRAPSFEAGDDKRYFSAGSMPSSQPPWGSRPERTSQPTSPPVSVAAAAAAAAASGTTSPNQGFRTSAQSSSSQGQPPPSATYRASQNSQASQSMPYPPRGVSSQGLPGANSRPSSGQTDQDARPMSASRQAPANIAAMSAATTSPAGGKFPLRQSSLSSQGSEPPGPSSRPFSSSMPKTQEEPQAEASAQQEDPMPGRPFIRPADIYRRMEEEKEKERQSMDSNRPSMDTDSAAARSYQRSGDGLRPLETLPERRSEYGMEGLQPPGTAQQQSSSATGVADAPLLPQISRFSVFGADDMWSSGLVTEDAPDVPINAATTSNVTVDASNQQTSLQHEPSQGYRTAVKQAFESGPQSTSASMSSTDIQSPRNESEISRSNTDSTAGISPIIGHASNDAGMPAYGQPATSIATITEEPADSSTPLALKLSKGNVPMSGDLAAPHVSHSRNLSATSSTPTVRPGFAEARGESPARAPSIEPGGAIREAEAARMDVPTPTESHASEATPKLDTARFSYREADLAEAVNASPEEAPNGTSAAVRNAQNEFLQSREGATVVNDARRESDASIASWTSSVDADKKTNADSKAEAPTAASAFVQPERPRLPGEWISAASVVRNHPTDGTPVDLPTASSNYDSPSKSREASQPSSAIDLSPNVATDPSSHDKPQDAASKAMAAAAGAGAALAAAAAAAVGMQSGGDHDSDDNANKRESARAVEPLSMSTNSKNVSLPKIDVSSESNRVSSGTQDNYESDRLRDEIEKSLTPVNETPASPAIQGSSHLSPKVNTGDFPRQSTQSTLYPREYDSYWAGGNGEGGSGSVSPSGFTSRSVSQRQEEIPAPAVQPAAAWEPSIASPTKPGVSPKLGMLNKRFSWEEAEEEQPPAAESLPATNVAPAAPASIEENKAAVNDTPAEVAVRDSQLSKGSGSVELYEPNTEVVSQGVVSAVPESTVENQSNEPTATNSAANNVPLPRSPVTRHNGETFAAGTNPPNLKEIAAIGAPTSKLEAYQKTTMHFSGMDTGLDKWLAFMLQSNPDNARVVSETPVGTLTSQGGMSSVRNRLPGAIGKLTTRSVSGSTSAQQPYYQQYLDAASSQTGSPGSATHAGAPASAGTADSPGGLRQSSGQTSKLLQTASVFGGKASHGAKGLFNKGKSKLKGGSADKVSFPNESTKGRARSSSNTRWSNLRQSLPFGSSTVGLKDAVVDAPPSTATMAQQQPAEERITDTTPIATEQTKVNQKEVITQDALVSADNNVGTAQLEPPRPTFAQELDREADSSDAEEWHDTVQTPQARVTNTTRTISSPLDGQQEADDRYSSSPLAETKASVDDSSHGLRSPESVPQVVSPLPESRPSESGLNRGHSRAVSATSDDPRISAVGNESMLEERESQVSSLTSGPTTEALLETTNAREQQSYVSTSEHTAFNNPQQPVPTMTGGPMRGQPPHESQFESDWYRQQPGMPAYLAAASSLPHDTSPYAHNEYQRGPGMPRPQAGGPQSAVPYAQPVPRASYQSPHDQRRYQHNADPPLSNSQASYQQPTRPQQGQLQHQQTQQPPIQQQQQQSRTASAVPIRSLGPRTSSQSPSSSQPKRHSLFGTLFSSPSPDTPKEKSRKLSKVTRPSHPRSASSSALDRRGAPKPAPAPAPMSDPYAIPPPRVQTLPAAFDAASIVTSYDTPRQPRLPDLARAGVDGGKDKPLPPGGMTEREREREAHVRHLAGERVFGRRGGYGEAPEDDQVSNRRSHSAYRPVGQWGGR